MAMIWLLSRHHAARHCEAGYPALAHSPNQGIPISAESRTECAGGWRRGFAGLAGFWAVLVIPPVLLFLTSARDLEIKASAAALPDEVREGLLSRRFFRLALAGFLTALVIVSCVSSLGRYPQFDHPGMTK